MSSLPDSFGGIENLSSLDLRNNDLTTLPGTFTGITKLVSLHLENNKLENLGNGFLIAQKNCTPPYPYDIY